MVPLTYLLSRGNGLCLMVVPHVALAAQVADQLEGVADMDWKNVQHQRQEQFRALMATKYRESTDATASLDYDSIAAEVPAPPEPPLVHHFAARCGVGEGACDADREAERAQEENTAKTLFDAASRRPCFLVCTPVRV